MSRLCYFGAYLFSFFLFLILYHFWAFHFCSICSNYPLFLLVLQLELCLFMPYHFHLIPSNSISSLFLLFPQIFNVLLSIFISFHSSCADCTIFSNINLSHITLRFIFLSMCYLCIPLILLFIKYGLLHSVFIFFT